MHSTERSYNAALEKKVYLTIRSVSVQGKTVQKYLKYYLTKSFFDCAEVWQNIIYHYSIFLSFQSKREECKTQQNKEQVLHPNDFLLTGLLLP